MQRTSRQSTVYPITVRELQVLRTERIGPTMQRVVLGGDGLAEHERNGVVVPAFRSHGFDDDVKIIVPDPVTGLRPVPEPQPGGTVAWTEESVAQARTYTIRRYDAEAGEVFIDFLVHGTGLASSWAQTAAPGDTICVAGPKASAALPDHRDWLLLAADETGLPAVARCLEELSEGHRVKVFAEAADPASRFPLTSRTDVDITWVFRSEGETLAQAVMDFPWWEGEPFVWVAGETLSIKPLRRWFKTGGRVRPENTEISGYWRHRQVASLEGDPQTVDLAASGPSPEARLHEATEITPALAIRTALSSGLLEALDEGPKTVADLARETDIPWQPLLRWLRLLASLDVVALEGPAQKEPVSQDAAPEDDAESGEHAPAGPHSTVRLGELGELVSDPDSRHARSLDRAATLRELSLVRLPEALREGGPVPLTGADGTWAEALRKDSGLREQQQQFVQEESWFTAPAVPGVLGLDGAETVHFRGPGSDVFAEQALGVLPRLTVTHDEDHGAPVEAGAAAGTGVDGGIVVLLDPFGSLPGPQAREALRAWCASGLRVVALSPLVDEAAPDPWDLEEDLRKLCLTGGTVPTRSALRGIAADAGAQVGTVRPVGWGQWLIDLAPQD